MLSDPAAANAWRSASRKRLSDVIRLERYDARLNVVDSQSIDGVQVTRSQVTFGNQWTLPVVELSPAKVRTVAIVFGDQGREALYPTVTRLLEKGHCVVVVDLLGFGETTKNVEPIEWQMIATVGRRPLGIQVGQLSALANWLHSRAGQPKVKLVAVGPRASAIALVAAAVEPTVIGGVEREGSWTSFKELIDRNLELKDAPEFGCFGLLKEFDIPQLEAMTGPRSASSN